MQAKHFINVLGLGSHHEVDPARVRVGTLGRDDLDRLPVFDLGPQRHEAAIDLRGDAPVADVGVHRVGEIDAGCTPRQAQDLALWRKDVDGVGEEVDLDVFHELFRVRGRFHLTDTGQPLARPYLGCHDLTIGVLVLPVRGDATLGNAIHLRGPDLHFDRHAVGAEQTGVQRLVTVHPRNCNVVLEASRHGLVELVDNAQRPVGIVH